jgi:hypothetical protein
VFGGVFPGVGDEVGKDVFDALDVHGNCRERGIRFAVELETAGFHQFLERLNRVTKQNIRGRGFPVQTSVALFEAGEIEQVIQDAKEAFGVFAGGGDQVEVFWIEGSDSVLEQQMQDHADAGEGGLDFVADGCDEVALGIVEEPEPGDVVKDGGDAEQGALPAVHEKDAREEMEVFTAGTQRNDLLEIVGEVISALLDDLADQFMETRGRLPVKLEPAREFGSGGVSEFDGSLGVEDVDGIGKGSVRWRRFIRTRLTPSCARTR